MSDGHDIRRRGWDFSLTVITVGILGLLGVQSFVGTLYTWWAQRTIAGWQDGTGYAEFVTLMNQIAAPLVVALVVVMGLCVPKRIFQRRALVAVSAAMLLAGVGAGAATGSLKTGLGTYLALAALIQAAVVAMTVAGVKGPSYLTEGRLTKTGSGLLHLGFIGVAFVIVTLERSNLLLPVFTVSALCLGGGTALSFYAEKLAWHRVVDDEVDEEWAEEPVGATEASEVDTEPPAREPSSGAEETPPAP